MRSNAVDHRALLDELLGADEPGRRTLLQRHGEPAETLLALIDEAARLSVQDAAAAIRATRMLAELAESNDHAVGVARALRAGARALSYAGRYEDGLTACRRAAERASDAGDVVETGRAQLASMHPLTELGRLEQALDAGRAARAAFRSIGDDALAARADINIGIVHQRRDDPSHAIDCFDRARPALAGDALTIGHLDNNRGEALQALHDFAGAEDAYSAALDAFERADAALTAGIAQSNLAELAARQGRFADAMRRFELARARLEAAHSPAHVARLIAERGAAKAALGLSNEALRDYQEALRRLDGCGLPLEAARARTGMGLVLRRLGRVADAETALAAAATAFDELGNRTARAQVDLARAEIAADRGRNAEARTLCHQALASLHDRPADAVAARHLLTHLAIAAGEYDLANAEIAAALAQAQQLDVAPLIADVLETRGTLHRACGRIDEALDDLRRAATLVDTIRGTVPALRYRVAFLGEHARLYERLADTYLEAGVENAVERAFETVERCKSRSLLDRMRTAVDVTAPDAAPAGASRLTRRLAECRAELNALYSAIEDESTPDRLVPWRDAVRDRERELTELESRAESLTGVTSLFARPVDVDSIRAVLGPDETLIEFFAEGDALTTFVVDAGSATAARGTAAVADVRRTVQRLRFLMERVVRMGDLEGPLGSRSRDDVRHELAALYDLLIKPIESRIADRPALAIVPHGPLHLVPFAALHDGQRHLVERHEVRVGPSASALHVANGIERSERDPLIVGVPDAHAPEIGAEVRAVARALGAADEAALVDAAATVARVESRLADAGVVHLACHGRFLSEAPLGSGLRLADGWLTVRDLYRLRLRADLVVLSGCETGVNQVEAGDELLGLIRGFLAAGAPSVLTSLWRVNDLETAGFMSTFHDAWRRDGDVSYARALADVQRGMIDDDQHPAFWAPFVLAGRR